MTGEDASAERRAEGFAWGSVGELVWFGGEEAGEEDLEPRRMKGRPTNKEISMSFLKEKWPRSKDMP